MTSLRVGNLPFRACIDVSDLSMSRRAARDLDPYWGLLSLMDIIATNEAVLRIQNM